MKRVVVTGIGGFTGRHLAAALKARGYEVIGLARRADPIDGVDEVHAVDISDARAMMDAIAAIRPTHAVHLAAISFIEHGDVDEIYRVNLLGTRHLLEALAALPERPQGVLLASSSNVYGNRHAGPLDEEMAPDPVNDYAVSKVAAEHLANLYRDRLPICIARPFNYTGRGQGGAFLIPKMVAHVVERRPVLRLGNLAVARDFSDVRFVTEAYCRLLETPAAHGQTVNVCSGRAYALSEVLDKVQAVGGFTMQVEVDEGLVRRNEVRALWGNPARLQALVGPIQPIPIEDTLAWMIGGPSACD